MLVLAIGGFWPQYFSAAIGNHPKPTTQFWLIHLHATIFTVWLLAYIAQAGMVVTGRTALHLRIGPWLVGFGFAAAAMGLYAAIRLAVRLGERVGSSDQAASFVFFPIIDMIFFASFLAVAVAYRKGPEVHKRAMLVATFSIAVVGLDRLVGRMGIENPWVWQPLMLAPLIIALVHDALVRHRIYGVMAVGLAVHIIRLNADGFAASKWWLPVGRSLAGQLG